MTELKKLRWMGITKDTWTREKTLQRNDWKYNVTAVGFKYHMNDLTAALGRVQLSRLDTLNERRRRIVREYDRGLQQLSHIEKPPERDYAKSAWHSYVIKLSKRNALHLFLQERGISTGIHYYPNHLYPVYRTHYRRVACCRACLEENSEPAAVSGLICTRGPQNCCLHQGVL